MNIQKKAFTLVELIVVITILAILGTIAFISLQGYAKSARDSVRISDISSIKKSLELFKLNAGKYPQTTDGKKITYLGSNLWTQGIFGKSTLNNTEKLDKIPLDPLIGKEYSYSVTQNKQEYQIAGIIESDEISNVKIIGNSIFAAGNKEGISIVSGNYNGNILKINTGGLDYILAVPSILTNNITNTDLGQILENKSFVYNGFKNLPFNYSGSIFDINGETDLTLLNSNNPVIFSGDINDLLNKEDNNARLIFGKKIVEVYHESDISGIDQIENITSINPYNYQKVDHLIVNLLNNNLGSNIKIPTLENDINKPYIYYKNIAGTDSNARRFLANLGTSYPDDNAILYSGQMLQFDGVDDELTLGGGFDVGTSDITYAFTLKTSSDISTSQIIFEDSINKRFTIGIANGKLNILNYDGVYILGGYKTLEVNKTYSIIGIYKTDGSVKLYVDKVLTTGVSTTLPAPHSNNINIGSRGGFNSHYLKGSLGNLQVWKGEWNQNNIDYYFDNPEKSLYLNNGILETKNVGLDTSNLVVHLPLVEGQGNIIYDNSDPSGSTSYNLTNFPLDDSQWINGGSYGLQTMMMDIDSSGRFIGLTSDALEFNGQSYAIPDIARTLATDYSFSIEFVYEDTDSHQYLWSYGGYFRDDGGLYPQFVYAGVGAKQYLQSTGNVIFVVATRDSVNEKVKISNNNGNYIINSRPNPNYTNYIMSLGKATGFAEGKIGYIKIHDKALTQEEISSIYSKVKKIYPSIQ